MTEIVFYISASCLLLSALMVVMLRQPVHAALSLIAAFLSAVAVWMLLQAEFLALVLIFVYIGAVMTLFLFVVMMLNVDLTAIKPRSRGALAFRLFSGALLVGMFFLILHSFLPDHLGFQGQFHTLPLAFSNTTQLGILLYGPYLFSFEVAGVILVLAMVASISLAFFGRKPGTKVQVLAEQHAVTKASRLKVHKLDACAPQQAVPVHKEADDASE